jgi:hypothetical protein
MYHYQKVKLWLNLLSIVLITTSCLSSRVYVPTFNPGQGLFFEEKGDAMLNVNFGTNLSYDGAELQAARSLTNTIGAGVYATKLNQSRSNSNFQYHRYQEAFLTVEPFSKQVSERHEFVFGIGFGKGEERDEYQLTVSDDFSHGRANYVRYSAQYTLGKKRANVESGSSLKTSFLQLYSYRLERHQNSITTLDINPKQGVFFEPSYYFRYGSESVKVGIQAGVSMKVTKADFNYDNIYLSIGLTVRPEQLYRKMKEEK